jgi:hypothetical protein
MANQASEFTKMLNHPFKFRLFLLMKIPSAFFSGVRIKAFDEEKCIVSVPYRWFSRNPFRSIYFACLSMAAEMSTGALAMSYVHKRKPSVSMMVVKTEGQFYKKAVGRIFFICEEGQRLRETIENAVNSNEGQLVTVNSRGSNREGEKVAEFFITWSFKARK